MVYAIPFGAYVLIVPAVCFRKWSIHSTSVNNKDHKKEKKQNTLLRCLWNCIIKHTPKKTQTTGCIITSMVCKLQPRCKCYWTTEKNQLWEVSLG